MSIAGTAVRRPIGTAMIYLGVLVVGAVALGRLSVDLLPDMDFPRVSVITTYEGVGAEEIETLITRPIEQAVSTIQGIDRIDSSTAEGISRVNLQFAWGSDLDVVVNDVRANLDRIAATLPEDAERPVIQKFDLSAVPVAQIGVSGSGDPRRIRHLADDAIARRLARLEGVAEASARGGRVREIQVELDAGKLVAFGISASEVELALQRDNRNVSAGDVRAAGREVLVRSVGEWRKADEIYDVLVREVEGRPVYIRDLATVRDSIREPNNEQWVNGEPGIAMSVSKQSGANTVEVVERVREEIERINRDYAGRIRLSMIEDSAYFIERSINNVRNGAMTGALLAVLVLLFFLRDVRATAVISTAIPVSILATFALMYFSGYTLNIISFGGLALGIGMLVDNGIVILENIYRKREQGVGAIEAAVQGTREVAPAVLAGTLTTVAVFAPVVFVSGFAGVFFGQMAGVISFSLFCSLVVAVTLVPAMSAQVLAPGSGARTGWSAKLSRSCGETIDAMESLYGRLVRRALETPGWVIACSIVLLLASIRGVSFVGMELMPEADEGAIDIDLEFPIGTPLERSAEIMPEVEARVRSVLREGEAASSLTSAGPEMWWMVGGAHEGEVELNLVPLSQRERGIREVMREIRKALSDLPDTQLRIRQGSANFFNRLIRGRSGERLAVDIRGHDREVATQLADRVTQAMLSVEGVTDARLDREEGLTEASILVDVVKAADLGLTRAEVAETIETYVLGRVATRLRQGGDEFDVRVQLQPSDRAHVDQLLSLPLVTPRGETVPLGSVARLEERLGPPSIERQDQERLIQVAAGIGDRPLDAIVSDLELRLADIPVPDGFTLAISGEHAEQEKTFGGLFVGILLAIFLVYTVMAVQFESLVHPLIIMASVPFAFVGVVATLAITGTTFNMNSFLGAIVLVAIVVNNAIVLVDYINLLRRERAMPLYEAVVEAAHRRLRPILMTTATTTLAMLPLAIGGGEGSEIQGPLARVVLGGLAVSTLVTLVVVPCLYFMVERRAERAAQA
jgi:HAE1 family hydrophobic/amphiphilic exporter-1